MYLRCSWQNKEQQAIFSIGAIQDPVYLLQVGFVWLCIDDPACGVLYPLCVELLPDTLYILWIRGLYRTSYLKGAPTRPLANCVAKTMFHWAATTERTCLSSFEDGAACLVILWSVDRCGLLPTFILNQSSWIMVSVSCSLLAVWLLLHSFHWDSSCTYRDLFHGNDVKSVVTCYYFCFGLEWKVIVSEEIASLSSDGDRTVHVQKCLPFAVQNFTSSCKFGVT